MTILGTTCLDSIKDRTAQIHDKCCLTDLNGRISFVSSRIIWGQSLSRFQDVPSFTEYGWRRVEGVGRSAVTPIWTLIPEASKACHELVKCSCKTKCSSRCKCKQFELECTELCQCNGQCGESVI